MKQTVYVLIIVFILTLVSCNRIKNKVRELTNKSEVKIKDKSKDLVNNFFPMFDAAQPDTKYNKQRFKEYLEIGLPEDVSNIYAFGDFLGADYEVIISFYCDTSTIQKIIAKKKMTLSEKENDEGCDPGINYLWWDKKAIAKLKPYKTGKENEFWKYLWYDNKTKKAYYEEFSL